MAAGSKQIDGVTMHRVKKEIERKTPLNRVPKVKQTCPSFARGHLPPSSNQKKYKYLASSHIDSFDYMLTHGLSRAVADITPVEFDVFKPNSAAVMQGFTENSMPEKMNVFRFWVEKVTVANPTYPATSTTSLKSKLLYPRHCRELKMTYAANMMCEFCYEIVQKVKDPLNPKKYIIEHKTKPYKTTKRMGELPLMVLSKKCLLNGKNPAQLVRLKEEQNEFGGYFIVKGIERCVRLLQIPRRNHPTAILRGSYKKRGNQYTDYGVAMRCSRHNLDETSITITLHYLTTGCATLRFVVRKQEFMIPAIIILRALSSKNESDEELYNRILATNPDDTFTKARAQLLLQEGKRFGIHTQTQALNFLGERFQSVFASVLSKTTSNEDVGRYLIKEYVYIHLQSFPEKMECLLFCLRKLYAFVSGSCSADNTDSLSNHELLLPGHLLLTFLKEKIQESLMEINKAFVKLTRTATSSGKFMADLQDPKFINTMVDRHAGFDKIGKKVSYLLSTGNVVSSTGLDLMQVSGYTIVAERLNFLRYCAHFRSVHRGSFFMEMKTTAVRKLLPDQWGFLCPVHTPDGGPCGLLSHMALKCKVICNPDPEAGMRLLPILLEMGVTINAGDEDGGGTSKGRVSVNGDLVVCIDGKVVGSAPAKLVRRVASDLRRLKVLDSEKTDRTITETLEIVFIPVSEGGPYPGLFLFTQAARMVRPVLHLETSKQTFIGPMEQPYLDIACIPSDIKEGITTYLELDPTNMLSLIASLTPFSDYNQSPRNMYQCQMGKQTMGTPAHSLPHRSDNKLYRLQNPQAPVVQTKRHAEFQMDEYPNGTNAIVAVLSYTGFDMEDAMILNKSSYERGFGHASVYKTMVVDIEEEEKMMVKKDSGGGAAEKGRIQFSNVLPAHHTNAIQKLRAKKVRERATTPGDEEDGNAGQSYSELLLDDKLGKDGLPEVGTWVQEGDGLYCLVDSLTGEHKLGKYKEKEKACIQRVSLLGTNSSSVASKIRRGSDKPECNVEKVSLTMRIPRNPVIGDKFSSRHGQKGVLSILWPQADMVSWILILGFCS